MNASLPQELTIHAVLGTLQVDTSISSLTNSTGYIAQKEGDGLEYLFPMGWLSQFRFITADFLLGGKQLAVFVIKLREGESGAQFEFSFGLLNECQARLRMPLWAVNQNQWMFPREGALLKPRCQGERVNLENVDRLSIVIERKGPHPVHFWLTPLMAQQDEPAILRKPILPKGPLLDEFGQSTLHDWSQKTRSQDELITRIRHQLVISTEQKYPDSFSRWGGWKQRRVEANGFFRTHHDGKRWWLIDPDGYYFWSSGLNCVRVDTELPINGLEAALTWLPDPMSEYSSAFQKHGEMQMFNYLAANLIRAFGPEEWYSKWAEIALAEIRRLRFNTVANWSDWKVASRAEVPYVRPLGNLSTRLPRVYRDFPDVFHPDFDEAALTFAEPLRQTVADPALIGYFLMNEPNWGFSVETPAAGMLFNTPECYSRQVLADFLRERYQTNTALASAWNLPVDFKKIAEGLWTEPLTRTAQGDLEAFSAVMVERFFAGLSAACKQVDPNHLNLGIRYYTIPPRWALSGMQYFDVFSMNCYRKRVQANEMELISQMLNQPVLIGEWHFGALDVGLPASGIGHVPDQESRGKAYRIYLEDAAAQACCVGVHYFILYDQSALGRFDGENYNIGFLDVCNQPYHSLVEAAIASHERMYSVASGSLAPYQDEPEYLPLLFM